MVLKAIIVVLAGMVSLSAFGGNRIGGPRIFRDAERGYQGGKDNHRPKKNSKDSKSLDKLVQQMLLNASGGDLAAMKVASLLYARGLPGAAALQTLGEHGVTRELWLVYKDVYGEDLDAMINGINSGTWLKDLKQKPSAHEGRLKQLAKDER